MKRLLIALCFGMAMAGQASAQQAVAQLHTDALPGQPVHVQFDANTGIVLDGGSPVAPDRDNLALSHVPPGSAWTLEIPAVVTVTGAQRVRVSCNVFALNVIDGMPFTGVGIEPGALLGATEHTFETGGPFLGRIALGVPRFAQSAARANLVQCGAVISGARGGVAWRAFEIAAPTLGAQAAQYVLEADGSRFISGVTFQRQVVLSATGYALTGQ